VTIQGILGQERTGNTLWTICETTGTMSSLRHGDCGVPLAATGGAIRHATFVYDAAMIRRRIADLAAFDVVRYARKACASLAILALVRREGAMVDAVSGGEIAAPGGRLRSRRQSSADRLYGRHFDREALDLCVERNVHVNCGSPDMIDQFGSRAPGRDITLRINPGFGHGHSQKTTPAQAVQARHLHTQIAECLQRAARHRLKVAGLHMHIGSGTDQEHLSQVCDAMAERLRRRAVAGVDQRGRRPCPPSTVPPIVMSTWTPTSPAATPCGSSSRAVLVMPCV